MQLSPEKEVSHESDNHRSDRCHFIGRVRYERMIGDEYDLSGVY